MAFYTGQKTKPVATFEVNDMEFVVIPRAEYERLLASAQAGSGRGSFQQAGPGGRAHGVETVTRGRDPTRRGVRAVELGGADLAHDEDAGAARIISFTDEALAAGRDIVLPDRIWVRLEGGENPVAVLRDWRGFTQAALAEAVGISQPYLSQIETGRRTPTVANLVALAATLAVPLDVLVPELMAPDGGGT